MMKSIQKSSLFSFIPDSKKPWILVLLALAFYGNSVFNDYVLDDGLVILENPVTQKGFSGLKEIFSSDAYDSYYKQMNSANQLSGGRYRPLSIATFAIEWELFGQNPLISHLLNILLFGFSAFFIFRFLFIHLKPGDGDFALLTTLLFIIHPIHTEVVANIKSRDEILSFLFIILALHSLLTFYNSGKFKSGIAAILSLFLRCFPKSMLSHF